MYGKIFTQMYSGTLASKGPWQALVTFQQLIVLSDAQGIVDMTVDAISRVTTIPEEIIRIGIAALEAPDEGSRTPDEDGRRIVRLSETRDWGWQIVNYVKYRAIRSAEDRREYHKLYQRTRRGSELPGLSTGVNGINQSSKKKERQYPTQSPSEPASAVSPNSLSPVLEERPSLETVSTPPAEAGNRAPAALRARGSRFDPAGGLPDDWRAWCAENRPDLDPRGTFDSFSDFWTARPGQAGVKLDWFATWRNWCRKEGPGARAGTAAPAARKVVMCAGCGEALTGAWTQSPRGRVCDGCYRNYRDGKWDRPASAAPAV